MHSLETIQRLNDQAAEEWQQQNIQFPEKEVNEPADAKVVPAIEAAMELSRKEDHDLFVLLGVARNMAQVKATI